MPTTSLMPVPKQQYFAFAGIPLVGGKIHTYAAGTNIPKQTFIDSDGVVAQANPITLNARGEPDTAIFWAGAYKVVVRDALGNMVYTVDNYSTDPAGVWNMATDLLSVDGAEMVGSIQSSVNAVSRTVQDRLRDSISAFDFMTVAQIFDVRGRTRLIDVTAEINKGLAYAASVGKNLFLPGGSYLLGTLTFIDPTGVYATRGLNMWALLFVKSGITIFGEGEATELFIKGGLVDTNWDQPGTKGFQVLSHELPTTAVNDFMARDFKINFNGLNNKVHPLNAHGNQSQCHGVNIEKGNNIVIERIHFVDHPGSQVIAFGRDTANCHTLNNRFDRCGWLDGTNAALIDHSTIFNLGTNSIVTGNWFEQTGRMPYGCAVESHGTGRVSDNDIVKYSGTIISAAIVKDATHLICSNRGENCTLGPSLYCSDNWDLSVMIRDNEFTLSAEILPAGSPAYTARNAIYAGSNNMQSSPGIVTLGVYRNKFTMIGPIGWITDTEDLLNACIVSQLVTSLTIKENTFTGFRGATLVLERQAVGSSVEASGNTFNSCGRKDAYVQNNAIVNYTNAADASHGNVLYALNYKNNIYNGCYFAEYLSCNVVVLGVAMAPVNVRVIGDTHDRWVACASVPATYDIGTANRFEFRYHVTTFPDVAKLLPTAGNLAKNSYGEITAQQFEQGWPCTFRSFGGLPQWNFDGYIFSDVAPDSTPFGVNHGDVYRVLRSAAGGAAGYYYTGLAWKKFGILAA